MVINFLIFSGFNKIGDALLDLSCSERFVQKHGLVDPD